MKFKFKAWMIYLIGMPITFGLGHLIGDSNFAFSLLVEYIEYGVLVLIAYYVGHRLIFGKKSRSNNQ